MKIKQHIKQHIKAYMKLSHYAIANINVSIKHLNVCY